MNENVRIRFSIGLLAAAVIHAVLLVVLFETVHTPIHPPARNPTWNPPNYDPGVPSVSRIEKLSEPQDVNLQAQGELKQQGTTICPPVCLPNRIVRPTVVSPSRVVPAVTTPSVPVIIPSNSVPLAAPKPQPPKKKYQIALFVGRDAKSQQLLDWFNRDRQLRKLRDACEFQVYTESNALYRTRFAQIVPADQFPVVLFQDSTGGHVHAAGRTMIPTTPDELYADLKHGYELYQQTRQAQKTGALKARGYSWDEAISPTMYLAPEDCPDGYCPVEPNDTWRPGDRVRDLLFDEVRDNRNALLWASAGELATIAMIGVAVFLLGFIMIKRGF
ncbi:hypothetical protein [Planctomycetes bacterium TBK1r]|uniref:Uncharacterized protein n=1 Tax=Stieleria magnilauensis TaxID=2527963 RepID=A0ABX5XU72_9BACT|nr:hypothetical protein TBK1r_44880 [Planctomycetes bacterium TBK1r]